MHERQPAEAEPKNAGARQHADQRGRRRAARAANAFSGRTRAAQHEGAASRTRRGRTRRPARSRGCGGRFIPRIAPTSPSMTGRTSPGSPSTARAIAGAESFPPHAANRAHIRGAKARPARTARARIPAEPCVSARASSRACTNACNAEPRRHDAKHHDRVGKPAGDQQVDEWPPAQDAQRGPLSARPRSPAPTTTTATTRTRPARRTNRSRPSKPSSH